MTRRNIIVTLQCFVKKGNKYLMLHRNPKKRIMPDVWMAPGGKREFNEGLFAAARREIMEETGLVIENLRIKLTGNVYCEDIDQEIFFHFIVADYTSGIVKQNPEDGELQWLTSQQIAKLDNLLAEIHNVHQFIFSEDTTVISYTARYDKGNNMTAFAIEKA